MGLIIKKEYRKSKQCALSAKLRTFVEEISDLRGADIEALAMTVTQKLAHYEQQIVLLLPHPHVGVRVLVTRFTLRGRATCCPEVSPYLLDFPVRQLHRLCGLLARAFEHLPALSSLGGLRVVFEVPVHEDDGHHQAQRHDPACTTCAVVHGQLSYGSTVLCIRIASR